MLKLAEKLYRKQFPKQLSSKNKYQSLLNGRTGLEIGGPSQMFTAKGLLPVYDYLRQLDGCNFSTETVWEGKLEDGADFVYPNKFNRKGKQFVAEGSDLNRIANGQYEVVISCHNLEHLANPIKALLEWKRILTDQGFLLLVLPHKDLTFDRLRPVTRLEHLLTDFKQQTAEDDQTHFEEIVELHDYSMDQLVTSKSFMANRLNDNLSNRCAHHHVFNTPLVADMLNASGWQILLMDVMFHNIFALARKSTDNQINNSDFLNGKNVRYNKRHLFPSDQFSASSSSDKSIA